MASTEIEILPSAATAETLTRVAGERALNRRNFMTALSLAGTAAGAALTASRSTRRPGVIEAAGPSQTDVLNFALNLEYLEATFYSYITQGVDLPAALTVGSGAITGAPAAKLAFTGPNAAQITDLLNEIYYDELNHVIDLRGALGSVAVARPAINLAAYAAVTASNALGLARLFEDVGVTAYAGAAAALSGINLTYAAQILAVEGFHAGALRLTILQNPGTASDLPTSTAGVTFTASAAAGSTTLANVYFPATATAIVAGAVLTGAGIGGGAVTIATVSTPTTNTAITATTVSGTAVLSAVTSFAGLAVGQLITGTGIPANSTIVALNAAAATITISANATASATKVAITVGTGIITLSAAAGTSTTNATYTVGNTDPMDVAPYDPGTPALAAAGPTANGGFFATSGGSTANAFTPAGLAFNRTTSQVLSIVYSALGVPPAAGTTKGGFFPNGTNGVINTI